MWTCDPKFSYRLLTGRRSKRGWSQSVRGNRFFYLILGSTRSWSAAWALYPSGRSEVYALAPGIPSLAEVERRDGLQAGIYRQLQDAGVLIIDEGVRVSRPSKLIDHLVERGIHPAVVIADTFAVAALRDCVNGRWPIRIRKMKWAQATEDIGAFRKLAFDGPLAVAVEGRRRRATKPSGARGGQMALEPKETRHRSRFLVSSPVTAGRARARP